MAMTLPLEGVNILELAEYAFVPTCAAVLGEWGAEVVKVERLTGDPGRRDMRSGTMGQVAGYNSSWNQYNRNKRVVALDLTSPEGRAALDRLVDWADVFVTSFRPQARRKLRLEPDDLWAVNPSLVYARGHGHGVRGPDAEEGGFDAVSYFARSGLNYMLSFSEGPPVGQRGAMGDGPSGLSLAGGIAAALYRTARTGQPMVVDVALLAFGMFQLSSDLASTSADGADPTRRSGGGMASPNPLTGTYVTVDGRHIQPVMLDAARFWGQMCRALGLHELAEDPAYGDASAIMERSGEIRQIYAEAFASMTMAEAEAALSAEGCIFSKVATPSEALVDPQSVANGYTQPHPDHPTAQLVSSPVQFDENPGRLVRTPTTTIGGDTDDVLAEVGFTAEEIAALRSASAIH